MLALIASESARKSWISSAVSGAGSPLRSTIWRAANWATSTSSTALRGGGQGGGGGRGGGGRALGGARARGEQGQARPSEPAGLQGRLPQGSSGQKGRLLSSPCPGVIKALLHQPQHPLDLVRPPEF